MAGRGVSANLDAKIAFYSPRYPQAKIVQKLDGEDVITREIQFRDGIYLPVSEDEVEFLRTGKHGVPDLIEGLDIEATPCRLCQDKDRDMVPLLNGRAMATHVAIVHE